VEYKLTFALQVTTTFQILSLHEILKHDRLCFISKLDRQSAVVAMLCWNV